MSAASADRHSPAPSATQISSAEWLPGIITRGSLIATRVPIEIRYDGVARPIAAHLLTGRLGNVAAGIAGYDPRHAGHVAVDGVETPETAAAQRRDFELLVTHLFHLFLWENGTTDYANL